MRRAAAAHPEAVRLVDVSGFAEFERWRIYALSDVLGSRSRAGSQVGVGVPLLSIHFREARVPCVAPHRDVQVGQPGELRTILDVLRMLDPGEQRRLFGEPA